MTPAVPGPASDPPWYADDLAVGMEFRFGSWPVTEESVIEFARTYDPQPMHTDREFAQAGVFGGLIASGIQTMGIYQALLVGALWGHVVGKAGRSLSTRLLRPVRPGMTLTGSAVITEIAMRPERGDAILGLHTVLVDDSGEAVCEIDATAVLFLRPGS